MTKKEKIRKKSMTKLANSIKRKDRRTRVQQSTNNWLKFHNYPMFRMNIREKILDFAMKSACDVDGDIIHYSGMKYYVHILSGTVIRVS